ncbi:uncharacterized protein CDAR_611051 [Caerostris darwini]|uniref:Uncharacterized protein n=1 Tax=Caerostris darwini TaxID=1538125 RepID=A0AAV4QCS6_9ARAC|nr:uncharacterized protein CDAR_611051 [Caerostris darwini]
MKSVLEGSTGDYKYCSKLSSNQSYDLTYGRIYQAADFISYEKRPHSVTRNDFSLRSLEPRENKSSTSTQDSTKNRPKRLSIAEKHDWYENFNPALLKDLNEVVPTYRRVMQAGDVLPSSCHQKSVTRKDFDAKPFDFYDHCLQNKPEEGQPMSIRGEKISAILSSLHEKGPLDKPSQIHTDYERSVNDTDCTFLRTMQAVDWKNPEPISKTMYETDFKCKFPGYKTLMSDSQNNICRNIPQSDENFEKGDGPSLNCENKMQTKLKTHSGKNDKCSSHPVCRRTAHIPKFQYSEPLLFPQNHCEKTSPFVNAKEVYMRWTQIMENTHEKQNKINHKQQGRCLPCYKEYIGYSKKDPDHCICTYDNNFKPLRTEELLKSCTKSNFVARLDNANPNFFRRDDFAQSSNKRVLQATKVILSDTDKLPASETAESLQKTQDLLPEYKAGEQKSNTAFPPKAKSFADFISPEAGEFPFTDDSYLRSGDLRNIVIPNAYLGYNYDVKSVAKSDYCPKLSLPEGSRLKPMATKSPPWLKFRKARSHFRDLDFPKREGICKFMDDEGGSFQQNRR